MSALLTAPAGAAPAHDGAIFVATVGSSPIGRSRAPHSEAAFARACLDPEAPLPPGIAGTEAARRFAVHRNTVRVTLVEALAVAFPVVRALVGEEFFAAAAGLYVAAEPPRSPVLALYGDGFADFLGGFPPAAELPYLPDVARLERLLTCAYHAADGVAASRADFAGLDADAAARLALVRHPATRTLLSPWPVVTLWRMNTGRLPLAALDGWESESALVTRPELDLELTRLPAGAEHLLARLDAPVPLATLAAELEDAEPGALARLLPPLLDAGALCRAPDLAGDLS